MAGILVAGIGIAYAGQPLNADVCVRRTGLIRVAQRFSSTIRDLDNVYRRATDGLDRCSTFSDGQVIS
jgi:hypothetical protein